MVFREGEFFIATGLVLAMGGVVAETGDWNTSAVNLGILLLGLVLVSIGAGTEYMCVHGWDKIGMRNKQDDLAEKLNKGGGMRSREDSKRRRL